MRWLWYPYIPFGKVTLLQGDPGDGKSKLMLSLAALLSKGAPLPFDDEDESCEPMTVIYQTTEDDADDTVVPRFNSAGGDGERLIFIKEDEKSLTFGDDRIREAVEKYHAKLLILDPMSSYIGDTCSMNNANETRAEFNHLIAVAKDTGCAIVIIAHNVALPDNFERILATMRSRRISVSIIIQNMAQLKALFKDSWENITGNCDTLLYLGGNEQSTHEYISKMLGKETIDTRTRGITKGQHGSSNTNYQNAGRELLTLDEVRLLDNSNALIFIRGERPLIDKKFDILSHPNIAKTADGKAVPYKHSKSEKYLRNDLSFTINEDLSNIKLLEVDGDNVKTFDFANPQTKQNEILEVTDNEKSENNSENCKNTENSPQG